MTRTDAPPRWDLTPIYGGLDDRAFTAALEGAYAGIDRLAALYDERDIRATEPRRPTSEDVASLEAVLDATNELQSELRRLTAYLYASTTTDSRDDRAAARQVELQTRAAPLNPLAKRLGAWLAALDVDELSAASLAAAEHLFTLRTAAEAWQDRATLMDARFRSWIPRPANHSRAMRFRAAESARKQPRCSATTRDRTSPRQAVTTSRRPSSTSRAGTA